MTKPKAHGRGLRLIAAFKLLKGVALLALGIGALKLLHKDVEAIIVHWINVFQVDPHSHFLQLLLEKLSILNDRRLKELSVGTSADNPYALEKQIDVFLCKDAKFGTLTQLWPKLKRWR